MKYTLSFALLIFISVSCNNTANNATESVANQTENTPAATMALPSFQISNSNNQLLNMEQFKGKKVFVNLWATWCPPCRAEMPSIEKLANKTDRSKVEFVLLSLDDNFDIAKQYAQEKNLRLPIYYPAGTLPQLFNVQGIPATFIFNENGELLHRQDGAANYDSPKFEAMLAN
jgi:thiol-disulfide isomerase/thioredoxin